MSKYTAFYKFYNSQIYEQALHLPSTLPPHSPSPIRIEAAHFPRLKVKLAARESSKKTNIKPSFLSYPLHLHSHPTPLPHPLFPTRQTATVFSTSSTTNNNYWQQLLATTTGNYSWQLLLKTTTGNNYWQQLLATSTDNNYWQQLLATTTGNNY